MKSADGMMHIGLIPSTNATFSGRDKSRNPSEAAFPAIIRQLNSPRQLRARTPCRISLMNLARILTSSFVVLMVLPESAILRLTKQFFQI